MTLAELLGLSVAGGLGALLRFHLTRRSNWGTLAVNLLGAIGVGLLLGGGWVSLAAPASNPLALFLGLGFLGALTTFSGWMLEVESLRRAGRWGLASLYLLGLPLAGVLLALLTARLSS